LLQRWQADVIAFCGNYLANLPEMIDESQNDHFSDTIETAKRAV
jgi:hypothetical protein